MKKQPWLLALMAALGVVLLSWQAWSLLPPRAQSPLRSDVIARWAFESEEEEGFEACSGATSCPEEGSQGAALVAASYKGTDDATMVRITGGRVILSSNDVYCQGDDCLWNLVSLTLRLEDFSLSALSTSVENLEVRLDEPVVRLRDDGGLSLTSGTKFTVTATARDIPREFTVSPEGGGELTLFLNLNEGGQSGVSISGSLSGTSDDGAMELDISVMDAAVEPLFNLPPQAEAGPDQQLETSCYADVQLAPNSTDPNGTTVTELFAQGRTAIGSGSAPIAMLPGRHSFELLATDIWGGGDRDWVSIEIEDNGKTEAPDGASLVEFQVPTGVEFEDVVLLASDALKVSDRVLVSGADDTRTSIVNLGPETTSIQAWFHADSRSDADVWSRPKAWLHERAKITGTLRTPVTPDKQNETSVGEEVILYEFVEDDFGTLSFAVPAPGAYEPVGSIEPEHTLGLDGGEYGYTSVKSRATLELSDSAYRFSTLQMEPDSVLRLAGQTVVVVDESATLRGRIEGQGSLLLVYLGSNEVIINSPFEGAIFAPQGKLTLTSSNKTVHKGAFFAKHIQVDSDAVVEHLPAPVDLIRGTRSACALTPQVQCVESTAEGKVAYFTYENAIRFEGIYVPYGFSNRIIPGPDAQGQPSGFRAGYLSSDGSPVFGVPFGEHESVSWVLGDKRATADQNSQSCE